MNALRLFVAVAIGLGGIIWSVIELATGSPALAIIGLVLIELLAALIQPDI